jgi:hypothetical protein
LAETASALDQTEAELLQRLNGNRATSTRQDVFIADRDENNAVNPPNPTLDEKLAGLAKWQRHLHHPRRESHRTLTEEWSQDIQEIKLSESFALFAQHVENMRTSYHEKKREWNGLSSEIEQLKSSIVSEEDGISSNAEAERKHLVDDLMTLVDELGRESRAKVDKEEKKRLKDLEKTKSMIAGYLGVDW